MSTTESSTRDGYLSNWIRICGPVSTKDKENFNKAWDSGPTPPADAHTRFSGYRSQNTSLSQSVVRERVRMQYSETPDSEPARAAPAVAPRETKPARPTMTKVEPPATPPPARDNRDHYPGARADFEVAFGSYTSPKHPSPMADSWGAFKRVIPDHATALKLRVAIAKYMASNAGSEYAYSFLNFLTKQWEGVYFEGRLLNTDDGMTEVISDTGSKVRIRCEDVDAYWLADKKGRIKIIHDLYYADVDTTSCGTF